MHDSLFLFTHFITHNLATGYLLHLILVCCIIILLAFIATRNLQLVPRGMQNIMEMFLELVMYLLNENIQDKARAKKYLPLIATLGLIILISNLIGIIPGFEAPTASLNLTLSLALIVCLYYHYEGIRSQGFVKYFAHFCGPVKVIAPFMFIIEIISHISRIISLSFRLFGNIKGDDLFLAVILSLVPYIAPLPPYFLLTFMAFLQTFVFMLLACIYISGAIALDEEH